MQYALDSMKAVRGCAVWDTIVGPSLASAKTVINVLEGQR